MYIKRHRGHTYLYQVDYGEEAAVARIIVRCDTAGTEGLFLVKQDGSLEPADDRSGFGANTLRHDGIWPAPPGGRSRRGGDRPAEGAYRRVLRPAHSRRARCRSD